jgi:hypothetical protein
VNVARETDKEAARFLAEGWGRPLLEREVDHGAVVPLSLLGERKLSVVVATIEESLRSSEAEERAKAFADAVSALAEGRNVWFLASFNTSAALSPRAPLTERSAGKTLDDAILSSLEDAEAEIPGDLWEEGGSCGAGPLSAWRHLFRGSTERLCYEFPYGVGYLVARA